METEKIEIKADPAPAYNYDENGGSMITLKDNSDQKIKEIEDKIKRINMMEQ